jgi:hypothetical protein
LSKQLVQDYEIDRLRKFSGTSTEGVISEAFKDLLKAWSRHGRFMRGSRSRRWRG